MKKRVWQQMMMSVMLLCLSATLPAAKQEAQVRPPQNEPLVSHALIQEAGWQVNWQRDLPVKTDEQIRQIFIHGPHVYALTDSNVLFCVDRQKGRTLFAVIVCQRDLPLCAPLFYEGKLGFVAGNQFHIFDFFSCQSF